MIRDFLVHRILQVPSHYPASPRILLLSRNTSGSSKIRGDAGDKMRGNTRCPVEHALGLSSKTLKLKDGKQCAYPVQNKWAARGPQCVLRTLSIVHLRRLFTLILPSIWWAQPMLFVLCLNQQSHPYNSMSKPNLSWSRAKCVISFKSALYSLVKKEMGALHIVR